MVRDEIKRVAAPVAIGIAVTVVLVLLLSGGSSYVLRAQFTNAGQLVGGDLVTVAGHPVGSVGSINLTPNGLAEVELDISDSSITPLRSDTLATIGQLSLTGVSNRFVSLTPGAGTPLGSGSVLPPTQTRGIVDLDTLLDTLTPAVRTALQKVIKSGAYLVSQPTASNFNQALHYLNPALSQTTQLGSELVSDRYALTRLVSSTAKVSSTLAGRSADLGGAVTNTAAVLKQVASQRAALQDSLDRAPGVLNQGTGVLADVNYSLGVLNPVLSDLQPVAPKLATLLRLVVPAASEARPTINGVEALVPGAEKALRALPPAEKKATPAVNSLTSALKGITPILSGLRPYMPEVVSGFFEALAGSESGYYDANGHFARIEPLLSPTSLVTDLLELLGGTPSLLNGLTGIQTGVLARCPGGAVPTAQAGGNPWSTPDTLPGAGTLCKPADNTTR